MDAGVFVTLAGVAPVEHEDAAIGTITEFHAAKPRVTGNEEVRGFFADVAATAAFEDFLVCTATVEVQREQTATILGRPVVALVNHHPDVCVAPTERVGLAIARILPRLAGVEVPVVRMLVDQRIRARVWVNRVRAHEVRAGEIVPEMTIDSVDEKEFAVLVPVVAPRIRAAAAQYFHRFALRMVAPDRAAHRNALFGRSAGHTEFARARRAAAAVEPAIGAKAQAVGEGV